MSFLLKGSWSGDRDCDQRMINRQPRECMDQAVGTRKNAKGAQCSQVELTRRTPRAEQSLCCERRHRKSEGLARVKGTRDPGEGSSSRGLEPPDCRWTGSAGIGGGGRTDGWQRRSRGGVGAPVRLEVAERRKMGRRLGKVIF